MARGDLKGFYPLLIQRERYRSHYHCLRQISYTHVKLDLKGPGDSSWDLGMNNVLSNWSPCLGSESQCRAHLRCKMDARLILSLNAFLSQIAWPHPMAVSHFSSLDAEKKWLSAYSQKPKLQCFWNYLFCCFPYHSACSVCWLNLKTCPVHFTFSRLH